MLTAESAYCDVKAADVNSGKPKTCHMCSDVTKSPNPSGAREVLALNLIRLRSQHGWSQEALAFECGLHRTFVAHVERKVRNISIDNIERLASALDVKTYELLMPLDRTK